MSSGARSTSSERLPTPFSAPNDVVTVTRAQYRADKREYRISGTAADTTANRVHVQPKRAEERSQQQPMTFDQSYPHIAKWVRGYGWIEWGDDLFPLERPSCIRALDEGGLIWAGKDRYPTLDDALHEPNRQVVV